MQDEDVRDATLQQRVLHKLLSNELLYMFDEGGIDITEERLHWAHPFLCNSVNVFLIDDKWYVAGELSRPGSVQSELS